MAAPRRWARVSLVGAVRDETVSPEVAALLIARDARPELDIDAQLARLDELAVGLRDLDAREPVIQAAALAAHLHGTHGLRGNEDSYYDARNSYLDEVLERRTGIPITLSVIYAAVGRRAGFQVDGVGFPGHFLARVGGLRGVLIDPFHGGRLVTPQALEHLGEQALGAPGRLRPEHLAAVGLRPLVVRMLLNLKRAHEGRGDHARAMLICDRLVDLTDAPPFRRDRGLHALALGAHAQAREDLDAYLAGASDARDAPAVRAARRRAETGDWSS
ncbi:MAG: transglutaminase-like domain-containing protein [Sandaracinaceae bacterium]